mgnify:CR=1 FL=1|tara:strand:- start:2457 stop:2966 length:510 start_codon:yes stop_codon:yes gene_type:complete
MAKEVHLNPIDEDQLEDKRNIIAENCFVEIDIALKGYNICFGEDLTSEEISLLHTTLAYLLSNHENEHNLANINIDKFEIPNSPFKTENGEPTDKLYHLTNSDSISFLTNMIMNSKEGFMELVKSGYLEGVKNDLMMEKQGLFFQLGNMFDRALLLMNNKYSKLILNIN